MFNKRKYISIVLTGLLLGLLSAGWCGLFSFGKKAVRTEDNKPNLVLDYVSSIRGYIEPCG
jgi:hypothetical protein